MPIAINLAPLQARFERLNPREKLMTVTAELLLVWAAWDNGFYQPQQSQQRSLATEIKTLENSLSSQQQLIQQLEAMDHNHPGQQKLAQLQQSVNNLKQQLGAGSKKFVPPPLMTQALRDMLSQQSNLQLVKLETLPVTPFGSSDAQQPAWVYRHALSITLQGDYFSTLNYLKSLEALPWRIQWDSIDYQVKDYPLAQTRIQVYTLSFEEDWLGA